MIIDRWTSEALKDAERKIIDDEVYVSCLECEGEGLVAKATEQIICEICQGKHSIHVTLAKRQIIIANQHRYQVKLKSNIKEALDLVSQDDLQIVLPDIVKVLRSYVSDEDEKRLFSRYESS